LKTPAPASLIFHCGKAWIVYREEDRGVEGRWPWGAQARADNLTLGDEAGAISPKPVL